jgi:hypothetical protein
MRTFDPFPLPSLSARLAILAGCASNLLAIVRGEGAPVATYPTVCRDAEVAFVHAALTCPSGAESLIAGLTDGERAFLVSVVAFPPVWTSSNATRRAVMEPFLTQRPTMRSGRRWEAHLPRAVSA